VVAAPRDACQCPTFFAVDPLLDPSRERPDFKRLMQELEEGRARYRWLYLELQ
jgi:hypothetical protein